MTAWNDARDRGVDVTADLIVVSPSRSKLSKIIPPKWRAHAGETEPDQKDETITFIEQLKDPKIRETIKQDTLTRDWSAAERLASEEIPIFNVLAKDGRWDDIWLCKPYPVGTLKNELYGGKSLAEIGKLRGVTPFDALCDLIIDENDEVYGLAHIWLTETAGKALINHPLVMVASDSSCKSANFPWIQSWSQPHRLYPYAFLLGTWVRDEKVMPLEKMVRKMTSLPARTLGLRDRGILAQGMSADIVIFNYDTIQEQYAYDHPYQYPIGVEYVIVNGQVVKDAGYHTGKLPGKTLVLGDS